ncbi:hypothetical protein TWF694_002857 [Orbilia ellipsospora]|uniref:F-box domain-containing protein n=1 Tax=Orbilia ellipsospora TaxID=2528407 RepID=A0AAV9X015_9PEZI
MGRISVTNSHPTITLPIEIQLQILEEAEWYQHAVLSQVCTAWRLELLKRKNRSKLYQPIHDSRYAMTKWISHVSPRIHKALDYHNILQWDEELKTLKWAHANLKRDDKPITTDISKHIQEISFNMAPFSHHPAFECVESDISVVIGIFTSRYRSDSGTFFTPQRLVIGETLSVGRFLDRMQSWRVGDMDYRITHRKSPTRWIFCNYFLDSCSVTPSGEKLVLVSVEMELDKPDKFNIPLPLFQPRPEIDFDRGGIVSRIARNHVRKA